MKKQMLNLTVFYTLLLCVLIFCVQVSELSAKPNAKGNNRDREISVMTRNMYLGTDFSEIFAARSGNELLAEVAEAYAEVEASKPTERIAGIADEIEASAPTLVGLQEVALWRIGTPFNPAPAETVTYDFLQLLLDELAARGLHYAPVAIQTNFDAEVPAVYSQTNAFDVRFTDRLVVLARTDLKTSQFKLEGTHVQQFLTNLTLPTTTLGTLTIPRGWISVDVKMRGKIYRVVNAHLESFSPIINYIQANELLQTAANTNLPLVFAGDFNTDAEANDGTYQLLRNAGFIDVWKATHPNEPGFTWALFLDNPYAYTNPTQRLDLILIRGDIDALDADVVGENPVTDRTPSGLMRSDHAGVIGLLKLKP
jgi:endonuclease/exonuclease/phosphatase family metal-dependent hydrolase